MVVDGEEVVVSGVDSITFGTLADLGFTEGSIEDLADGGVAVQRTTAEALGVEVGGSIDVVWPSGDSATIEGFGVLSSGLHDASTEDFLTVAEISGCLLSYLLRRIDHRSKATQGIDRRRNTDR